MFKSRIGVGLCSAYARVESESKILNSVGIHPWHQARGLRDFPFWSFRSGRFGLSRFGLGRFSQDRFGLGTFRSDYELLQKSYILLF